MADVDASFLPIVYDILRSVEKESQDVTRKIDELKSKLQKAREQIEKLNGIEYNKREQERHIEILRQQLVTKTDLIQKYKKLANFDASGLTSS